MRNLKRVLSMALASVMVLGLTVVGASAANFNDQAEIEHTTAAAVMNAIGVIEGNEKGDFMPDQVLTREQAAKIICYMLMGPENAEKLGVSGTKFSDVAADRWSAPYIAYCANMGILAGDGTGKFNPEGELTGHAFAKMLLVALGYDATIQNYVGNSWSINVATDAVNAGIYVDGTVMSNPMTRDEAAQMAFQTLSADMVKYTNKGSTITVGGVEIVQGASSPEKVAATGKGYDEKGDNVQQFCEKYFKDLKKATTDEKDDMGRPAVTWSYDGDEISTVTDSADKTLVADEAYASYEKALKELLDNDKATIAGLNVTLNGESTAKNTAAKIGDVLYVYETDTKNAYDVVVARRSFGIIDEIDTKVKSSDEKDGVKAYVTVVDANGTKKLTDVKDTDFAGFAYKEGDAIAYVAKDKKVIDSYALESVEGKITAYKADEYVRVDGTKYELSGMLSDEASGKYDFDESYTLYTDANGYVLGIKGEAGVVSLDEVYYVAKIYTEPTTSYGKTTYNSYAQAVAMDGTVKEILIEKDGSDNYQGGKVTEGELYTFKENEDDSKVFDGTEYTTDKNYTVFDVKADSNGKVAVTSSTTRLNGNSNKRAYIEKSTKFVLVEGSADKLETKTYTGSARVTVDKAIAITDKDDTAVYVILIATNNAGTVTEEDALIYIASTGAKVANGYEAEAYDMNGNAVENVVVKNSVSAGLYTFAINDDGVYVDLNKVNSTSIKDDEGYAIDATITAANEKRGTVDFTSGAKKYEDYDAAKATIIDLRSDDNMNADKYDREITNLGDLESAVAAGEVKADLYVNDSIQVIFVTSCVNAD